MSKNPCSNSCFNLCFFYWDTLHIFNYDIVLQIIDISGVDRTSYGRGRLSPSPDPGRGHHYEAAAARGHYDGRGAYEAAQLLHDRNRRVRLDNLHRRQMARSRLEGSRCGSSAGPSRPVNVSRHASSTTCKNRLDAAR